MKEMNFIQAMEIISYIDCSSDFIRDILKEFCVKGHAVDRKIIDDILKKYNIEYESAKEEFLDIILSYAMIIVKDSVISASESSDIKYLKDLFKINKGDFFALENQQIKEIIQQQLYKLYVDNSIEKHKALFKSDLQDLFDLSNDQMALFVSPMAYDSLKRGADKTHLKSVFPGFQTND
jgi:hypothetical protein